MLFVCDGQTFIFIYVLAIPQSQVQTQRNSLSPPGFEHLVPNVVIAHRVKGKLELVGSNPGGNGFSPFEYKDCKMVLKPVVPDVLRGKIVLKDGTGQIS